MGGTALRLFPVPRELRESGPGAPADARVERVRDDRLPPEGFALDIEPAGVRIAHADAAGLRYAEAALAQIRRRCGAELPGLALRDAPDFPVRGYMLDVSRDRVPTRETLERLVGLLALCRLNQLQLYTEHTFAYRDHETVWRDASPLTGEDMRWLDALCREYGIELVANQNTFGHMERWLRHDAYRDRAEAPEGWRSPTGALLPSATLEPTEANAEFALGLVRELMSHFSSRRINIGCDETFELGMGRSRERVERLGRGAVFAEHLKRLLVGLQRDGCEVLFWGDMLRLHPEQIAGLPREGSIALAWHYEAPLDPGLFPEAVLAMLDRFGITAEGLRGFEGHVPPFEASGLPYWVCPGTSSWNSLVGRWENARENLLDAAQVGLARGAQGLLITDWGDNGHLQPPSVSFAPLVYGAGLAWGVERNRDLAVAEVLDELVFEDAAGELGGALLDIGRAYAGTGKRGLNASPLQTALLRRGLLAALGEMDVRGTRRVLESLEGARERIDRAQPRCGDGELVRRELVQAIRLARHGARRLLREAGAAAPSDAELRLDLSEAIEEQRQCWLARSRPGGLTDSLARLEDTLSSYEA